MAQYRFQAEYLERLRILFSLLAEDFVITVEDGTSYGKDGYMGHSTDTSVLVEVAELSQLRVRMHGNTSVVTGAFHEKGVPGSPDGCVDEN